MHHHPLNCFASLEQLLCVWELLFLLCHTRQLGCMAMQVFVEVEKAMDSLPSQQSKASARNDDYETTDAHGAGQLAAA